MRFNFGGKYIFSSLYRQNEALFYRIENNAKTFCIKETTEGWNIDFVPRVLAYLDIYFDDDNKVIKALIRERKQTFRDKIDGKGEISTEDFKTTFIWKKMYKILKKNIPFKERF